MIGNRLAAAVGCLRGRGLASHWSIGLLASGLIWCWYQPATAQLRGDRDLLRLVAVQHRANREAILTWQGEIEATYRVTGPFEGKDWDLTTVTRIVFACDRAANKSMFFATQNEEKGTKQGKPIQDSRRLVWGGIRTPDGFQEVLPWNMDGKEGQPKRPMLMLQPLSADRPGDFAPHADPLWYLTLQGMDVHERLMWFYDAPPSVTRHLQVSRTGNEVRLEIGNVLDKRETSNTHVFDLDQGGNVVQDNGSGDVVHCTRSYSHERVAGVWVPKTAVIKNRNLKTGRMHERTMTWLKNVVNESVSDDAFSPERLAIRGGDLVRDVRSGTEYRYEESTNVTAAAWMKKYSSVLIAGALLLCTASAVLVSWRIHRGRKRAG
jgi:hypothetical protein